MKTRVRAKVVGRVQGVGFRPTVYRYATQFGLCGFVCNGPHGVTLEVEGDQSKVGAFFDCLTQEPPQQAVIADIKTEVLRTKGYRSFEVIESEQQGQAAVHISPDLATCDDCLKDILDTREPPLWVRIQQLHELRPAIHHHPRPALRPGQDIDEAVYDV